MIRITQVQFGEDGGLVQGFEGWINEWKWVPVLYCDAIESSKVNTGSQCLVLLGHKEKPCPKRRGGWSNEPSSQGVTNVLLHSLSLRAREVVESAGR